MVRCSRKRGPGSALLSGSASSWARFAVLVCLVAEIRLAVLAYLVSALWLPVCSVVKAGSEAVTASKRSAAGRAVSTDGCYPVACLRLRADCCHYPAEFHHPAAHFLAYPVYPAVHYRVKSLLPDVHCPVFLVSLDVHCPVCPGRGYGWVVGGRYPPGRVPGRV